MQCIALTCRGSTSFIDESVNTISMSESEHVIVRRKKGCSQAMTMCIGCMHAAPSETFKGCKG